ncbi:1-deoxy-D-xylulose-5-phosphate reductoisomerase [uncultured Intestinimonas sp.]|uniref:1-deoxy-D-xylulose-5-phosphate reductoisomerase n=1 Tax=uncultured Intestinimonas sp. TaxID=1689265 RepID=UPI0025FC816C|nr:1-deoxy-D-xylulose-5-phosphate reductoisomerase [uncultured Intestinimonas sp.]
MRRTLSILGSTGSIGRQTLEVAQALDLPVAALTAHQNAALLEEQARRFRPELAVCAGPAAAADLKVRLADTPVRVAAGPEGLLEAAALPAADTVVTAVVGIAGLEPTLAAVRAGKRIALANKETLVCAGELVMDQAEEYGAEILPVDSEHSALFQCLQGCRDRGEVRRLILTASGGPFFGWSREALAEVTPAQALKHPNWSMGAKISVDSATLMNKGLEYIEAMRLYHMPPEKISVVIHRESIIHSLVEYCDYAVLAQLGAADMRLPIQYALTWPERTPGPVRPLNLLECPSLTFQAPDLDAFPCLGLALEAARTGGTATAVLNGANEAAVGLFLAGKLSFPGIAQRVALALERLPAVQKPGLTEVLGADQAARALVTDL